MTTEEPAAASPELPHDPPAGGLAAPTRQLQRRTSDRVVGGVAGGLADYLNIDPILFRVAFAGSMIFGGAGLVLYVLGWALIPATGQPASIVQSALHSVSPRVRQLGAIVLVVVAVVVLSPWSTNGYFIPPEVFWALIIALVGVVLLLPRDQAGIAGPRNVAPAGGVERSTGGVAAPAWAPVAVPTVPVHERSPLGWYVLAGVLLTVGVLALIATVATVRVLPGQYFGAGFLTLGLGLVVGAWWGQARRLILLGLTVLPLAATSAFLTVPLDGGVADTAFRPQTFAEVQTAYHLVAGRLRIDLTDLAPGTEPIALTATVGVGDLLVFVPRNASVQVEGTVQGGRLVLFGRDHVGTSLADHIAEPGQGAGVVLMLNLDVGIGQVWVERADVGAN